MKKKTTFLLSLTLLYIAVFFVGKLGFLFYNHSEEVFGITDVLQICWHGLSMDLSTTGYIIAVPWLCCLIALWIDALPLRKALVPYYIITAILLSAIIVGDAVMYEFWKFKLDSTVFSYMKSTEGASNSVSTWFLASRLTTFTVFAIAIAWLAVRITPSKFEKSTHRLLHSLAMVLMGSIIFLFIRGGVQESTMNVGVAYYSPTLFYNHAAVNPAFSLMASISKNKDFSKQFDLLAEEEREKTFADLYGHPCEELTDTLLRIKRPNILIVLMESYGGTFIKELGGKPDVSPNFSRLISEGVFWDNMYANSFRTDRGTVSVFSGWLSYPTASLMRIPGRSATLPSIPHTLNKAGYECDYLYGGDINIMGKRGYLVAAGYEKLTYDKHFSTAEVNESKWGANDRITAQRTFEMIKNRSTEKPWHMGYQTLSSHEPYEVPYQRLDDKILNAFAFTDDCVGQLVDSLKTLPSWEQTLVILLPDHGSLYEQSYQNPEFFHCPMLWLGGAIKNPRTVHTLLNQSDLAATLLGQLGLPYDDFPWSRNVLSKGYTYPFAYSSFPSGILFKDSTGVTVFDTNSNKPITEQPSSSKERLRRAKAILQTSYDLLDAR